MPTCACRWVSAIVLVLSGHGWVCSGQLDDTCFGSGSGVDLDVMGTHKHGRDSLDMVCCRGRQLVL